MPGVHKHHQEQNLEITAVCDPWRVRREMAAAKDTPVESIERPDHFLDWLQCLRTRKPTICPIETGCQHSVAVIMAMKAFDTGRRQVYDPATREIREG
jgi:hypothetical protein